MDVLICFLILESSNDLRHVRETCRPQRSLQFKRARVCARIHMSRRHSRRRHTSDFGLGQRTRQPPSMLARRSRRFGEVDGRSHHRRTMPHRSSACRQLFLFERAERSQQFYQIFCYICISARLVLSSRTKTNAGCSRQEPVYSLLSS